MFEGAQRADAARITVVERDAIIPVEVGRAGEPHNQAIIMQGPRESHRELMLRTQRRVLEFAASDALVKAITVALSTGGVAGQTAAEDRAYLVKSLVKLLAPEQSRLRVIARGARAELRHSLLVLVGSLTETGSTRASVSLDFAPQPPPNSPATRGATAAGRRASDGAAVEYTPAIG